MADRDLYDALRAIRTYGESDPADRAVRLAVEYLRARVPLHTPPRLMLLLLEDNLSGYADALFTTGCATQSFQPVLDALESLTSQLAAYPPPPVRTVRDPGALAEVAAELGVRSDWHEPDEQEVHAHVTGASFDNTGHATLEMMVILYQEGRAVAQVNLALLLAWACKAAPETRARLLGHGASDHG
jgi:hypothetical protein